MTPLRQGTDGRWPWAALTFAVLGCSDKPYTPFATTSAVAALSAPTPTASTTAAPSQFIRRTGAAAADPAMFVLADRRWASLPIVREIAGPAADSTRSATTGGWKLAVRSRENQPAEIVFANITSTELQSVARLSLAPTPPESSEVEVVEFAKALVLVKAVGSESDGSTREQVFVVQVSEDKPAELIFDARRQALSLGETVTLDAQLDETQPEPTLNLKIQLSRMAVPFEAASDAAVQLSFVRRASGFARSTAEPAKSFASLAAQALAHSRNDTSLDNTFERIARIARLASIVCKDVGAPSLFFGANDVTCQSEVFMPELAFSLGSAALRLKEPHVALAALEWLHTTKSPRVAQFKKLVADKIPEVATSIIAQKRIETTEAAVLPPLTFDSAGDLLVADAQRVTIVAEGGERNSDAIIWPRTFALNQAGQALEIIGARSTCHFPYVALVARSHNVEILTGIPSIEVLRRKDKSACKEGPLTIQPVAADGEALWFALGFEAFRARPKGSALSIQRAKAPSKGPPLSPPGAARLPDGNASAFVSRSGIAVANSLGKLTRWKVDGAVRQCVPGPQGDLLGCIAKSPSKTEVLLLAPNAP